MSSFFSPFSLTIGPTGPTGPTGLDGPVGVIGPRGQTGSPTTGPTGSNITLVSLVPDGISFQWTNNQTLVDLPKGPTGFYQVLVKGATGLTNSIVSVTTQNQNVVANTDGIVTSGSVLTLKNLSTTSSGITLIYNSSVDGIDIRFINSGDTFTGSDGQILGGGSGNTIRGITSTFYNEIPNQTILPIRGYYEGLTHIDSVTVTDTDTDTVEWNIDISGPYRNFQLKPRTDMCILCTQSIIISINDTTTTAITIIIPKGITNGIETTYTLHESDDSIDVLFPIGIPPKLTDGLDIINMIILPTPSLIAYATVSTLNSSVSISSEDLVNEDYSQVNYRPFTDNRSCVPPIPTILDITPSIGGYGGGSNIIISGSDLQGSTLTIDGITHICVNNSAGFTTSTTTIGGTVGSWPVIVYTTGGTAGGTFTYISMSLSSVKPNRGPTGGG